MSSSVTSGEPPTKRPSIDFNRCLKCQGEKWTNTKSKGKELETLTCPKSESYQNFLDTIELRAEYGNQDFVQLNQRMRGLSAEILNDNHAVWHRTCYSEVTHKGHTERDQKRYEKALTTSDPGMLSYRKGGGRPTSSTATLASDRDAGVDSTNRKLTRSHVSAFNRELCFYCQEIKHTKKHARAGSTPEELHICRSANIGQSIKKIVDASDKDLWKLNMADILADGDFLSRDIRYHKSCHTMHWQRYLQHPQRPTTKKDHSNEDTVAFISAEIEFFAELRERLDNGDIITLTDVAALYSDMMYDHRIPDKQISRQALLAKIEQNITNFTITDARGRKPAVIHSRESGRSAIDQAMEERDLKADITAIYRCSKVIRQAVLQTRKEHPWSFDGSLVGCGEAGVPAELMTLMRWILQGAKAATTETRTELLHKSCLVLSQSIVQACKTDRQVALIPYNCTGDDICQNTNPITDGQDIEED